ncbi:MAG: DUF4845 domain-containing protein [Natronospirillum sp.]|uniref:DUF4845 domain-containing protein n=1 Tax=Natronospirillum sp. TaxID=2812955 RepID=UPI0025DBFC11|nr:DUF4845 domain-containing protein [Natronospirillum sp.]MCH8550486.1 DUF4845 domain-containing protein [Natronospirillum sp.]
MNSEPMRAHQPGLPGRQRGAGKLILLLILVVVLFFVMLAVRLVPVYVEFMYARSIVENTLEGTSGEFDRREFLDSFQRRARVNQVNLDNSVFTFSGRNPVTITLEYERRVPVMFNVDAVASFNEQYTY